MHFGPTASPKKHMTQNLTKLNRNDGTGISSTPDRPILMTAFWDIVPTF
jgi:hypothetical protein